MLLDLLTTYKANHEIAYLLLFSSVTTFIYSCRQLPALLNFTSLDLFCNPGNTGLQYFDRLSLPQEFLMFPLVYTLNSHNLDMIESTVQSQLLIPGLPPAASLSLTN